MTLRPFARDALSQGADVRRTLVCCCCCRYLRAFLERFLLKSVTVVVAAVGGGNDVKIERVVVVEIVFTFVFLKI